MAATMKVVYTQDHGKSRTHDIRDIRLGYARYLFRYGFAVPAYPEIVSEAEKRLEERKQKALAAVAEAKEVADTFKSVVLEFIEKANEEGHLFGSVAESHIADALAAHADVSVEVSKDQVEMDHIKEAGEHTVSIRLADGVHASVKVVVTAEEA